MSPRRPSTKQIAYAILTLEETLARTRAVTFEVDAPHQRQPAFLVGWCEASIKRALEHLRGEGEGRE